MSESVAVSRGFQPLNSHRFSHQIKCIAQQSWESVALHYAVGSESVVALCPFKHFQQPVRCSVGEHILTLIYTRKYRLFVASCTDLTLRVFNEHFDLIDSVHLTATVLSLAFNEQTSELFSGGVGGINTWTLRHQLHSPLVPSRPLHCAVWSQWVLGLYFDPQSGRLVAASQDALCVIDTQSRRQTALFPNTHNCSITSAVLYNPLEFVVSAAKDGSIKVWNCLLLTNVHTFTGHLKAVTGLQTHPHAPCVLSCSLDGTVRMWHLENLIECCRFDCAEELLGMTCELAAGDCRLACYSSHTLHMWSINQLETPFSTVSSDVLHMARVEDHCTGRPARILALAEDGGVRLLSPVSGRVITTVFPMLSSQMIEDVVYSCSEGLLFALLRTSELLLLSALTNPCTATQLWAFPPSAGISCIASCTLALPGHAPQCVVFGGQQSGYISLLHGRGFSMPHPCPAHAGHVIRMTGSCHPITANSTALVSYGDGNMLNFWTIEVDEFSNIYLELKTSTSLTHCPTHLSLAADLLCVAMANSNVVMYHTSPHDLETAGVLSHQSEDDHQDAILSLLSHQPEDDHQDAVLSLSVCPALLLFATASKDGAVKIWSSHNQLVSEMHFGKSLSSVCFGNARGDLFVGFQSHISLVRQEDFLPVAFAGSNCSARDEEDIPITFDPDLQFWYDPARVPTLPAAQADRKQISAIPLPLEERAQSRPRRCVDLSPPPQHQQQVPTSNTSQTHACNSTSSVVAETYSKRSLCDGVTALDSSSSLPPVYSAMIPASSEVWPVAVETNPPAVVTSIESPSAKFTIAPDGLIPNSTVRAKIGYTPQPLTLPVSECYHPPNVSLPSPSPSSLLEGAESGSSLAACSVGAMDTPTCMSRILQQEYSEEMQGRLDSSCSLDVYHGDTPASSSGSVRSVGAYATSQLLSSSGGCSSSLDVFSHVASSRLGVPTSHDRQRTAKHSTGKQTRAEIRRPKSPSLQRDVVILSKQSQPMPVVQEHAATTAVATELSPRKAQTTCQPNSTANSNPAAQATAAAVHVSQIPCEDTENLLSDICSHHWFPRQPSAHTLSAVFECLLRLLATANQPVFSEVCSALLEVKRACLLSAVRVKSAVRQLLARVQQGSTGVKSAVLSTLAGLGTRDRATVLAILPLLTERNLTVRSAAFTALKVLTGISNRAHLHQLLIDTGLLHQVEINEDEVISQLAVRMEKKQRSITASSHSVPTTPASKVPQRCEQSHHQLPPLHLPKGRAPNLSSSANHTLLRRNIIPSDRHYSHQNTATISKRRQTPRSSQQHTPTNHHPPTTHTPPPVKNTLYQLLALQPNSFSQSRAAITMMVKAYDDHTGSKPGEEFTWDDVLPVGKGKRRLMAPSVTDLERAHSFLPVLEHEGGCCLQEKNRGVEEVGTVTMVVKLPRISASKLSLT